LYVLACLAERGFRVAIFDFEFDADDHRLRLERLFPAMPRILYARCERPLVYEVDRLRRIVRDNDIEYIMYDSIVFACDGPAEAAEVAGRYFRAVRQIGAGSLHIAHTTKNGDQSDMKPFGSTFWANGARASWFARADAHENDSIRHMRLYNRKSNLGPLQAPVGFSVTFAPDRTMFAREYRADDSEPAGKLTIRRRMVTLLRKGDMTAEEISQEIGATAETVKRTARRHKDMFEMLPDGRIGLDKGTAWMRETVPCPMRRPKKCLKSVRRTVRVRECPRASATSIEVVEFMRPGRFGTVRLTVRVTCGQTLSPLNGRSVRWPVRRARRSAFGGSRTGGRRTWSGMTPARSSIAVASVTRLTTLAGQRG
jgi:hypothetical protein